MVQSNVLCLTTVSWRSWSLFSKSCAGRDSPNDHEYGIYVPDWNCQ